MAQGIFSTERVTTREKLPPGYSMLHSEFGGYFCSFGDWASDDFRTQKQAGMAARRHYGQVRREQKAREHAMKRGDAPGSAEAQAVKLEAIRARLQGEWDNPALMAFGPLLPDAAEDVARLSDTALVLPITWTAVQAAKEKDDTTFVKEKDDTPFMVLAAKYEYADVEANEAPSDAVFEGIMARATPAGNFPKGATFQEQVAMLTRPYLTISKAQYLLLIFSQEWVADIFEIDGTYFTYGDADNGYALMPLNEEGVKKIS
ncbi:hypothetical protein VRRI112168_02440 [Vreelandella rituensis]|uniref:Uncharacterized protein n=1 Tax=Vreelandella rituensis TaxID=2282306 RepID=A0A368UBC2_9GAMM|nr:hypothetical protein [Halomonas rituensis]RCV93602.1 hypothetical protein DU506_00160 [Halomonas rituensis]